MGYTTTFKGVLQFEKELTTTQLKKLAQYLGEDIREHPEWGKHDLTYIDLVLTKDFAGLEWDGSEKTYDLVDKVNLILDQMRKEYPDFNLTGSLNAQGEDSDDRWTLKIVNKKAVKEDIPLATDEIICPDCGHLFKLSEAKKKKK